MPISISTMAQKILGKPKHSGKKGPKIGDLIEIKTSKGLAYAQYTHEGFDPYKGFQTMRQIDGFFQERPSDLDTLAAHPTLYHFRMLLKLAIKNKSFEVVGNVAVPRKDRKEPRFRSGLRDPQNDNKMVGGWISEGTEGWPVRVFTPEDNKLSMDGMWSVPTIIDNLEIGWLPELDASVWGTKMDPLRQVREEYYKRIGFEPSVIAQTASSAKVTHYFIFKSRKNAQAAINDIKSIGLDPENPQTADDKTWLIVAYQEKKQGTAQSDDSEFEKLGKKYGGYYDGSENYVGS